MGTLEQSVLDWLGVFIPHANRVEGLAVYSTYILGNARVTTPVGMHFTNFVPPIFCGVTTYWDSKNLDVKFAAVGEQQRLHVDIAGAMDMAYSPLRIFRRYAYRIFCGMSLATFRCEGDQIDLFRVAEKLPAERGARLSTVFLETIFSTAFMQGNEETRFANASELIKLPADYGLRGWNRKRAREE